MRWLLLFALGLAGGCGESYVAPQAATRVELTSIADLNTAYANLKAHILAQGFEQAPDKPVPDFMLEHHSAGMRWRLVHTEHFSRERGGLFDRESAFIQLTPYPDVSTGYQIANGYNDATPHWPFLEVHVLESRPDGFSPGTIAFYADLVQSLSTHSATVVDLGSPVPGDAQVYADYVRVSILLGVMWWLAAWCISITVVGGVASWLIGLFDWSRRTRRLAFITVGGLLATPLPVPTMLLTALLPNALLVWTPAIYVEVFARMWLTVATMFAASFALSTLAAMIFIRERD